MPVTSGLIALYICDVWGVCVCYCVKGGELKQITNELRVFDPGRLLVVRVGNLNE